MTDLPIVATPAVTAVQPKSGAEKSPDGRPARAADGDDTNGSTFQDALASELDTQDGGTAPFVPDPRATAIAKALRTAHGAAAGKGQDEDATQALGDAGNASMQPAFQSEFPLTIAFPGLAQIAQGANASKPANADPDAFASAIAGRKGATKNWAEDVAERAQSRLDKSAEAAAANFAAAGKVSLDAAERLQQRQEFGARDQGSTYATNAFQAAHSMAALGATTTANSASAAAPSAAAAPLQVEQRVGDKGWDRALGEKMVWMTGHQKQTAELHLNPPELGPLKITITLNDDQATAQFISAHAQVREAIESAMPRLREMLADSGISLGNASVSSEAFREPQQEPRSYTAATPALTLDAPALQRGERQLRSALGLVDTFA